MAGTFDSWLKDIVTWLSDLLFGQLEFPEREEFREFQYKFLILLQIFGAVTSALYVLLVELSASPHFNVNHMRIVAAHAVLMLASWLVVRGRKQVFVPIAWFTSLVNLADLFAAFILVDNDEVRVLWLVITIPSVFLVLGLTAGTIISLAMLAGIVLSNPHVAQPLSPNAFATVVISMVYLVVFYHAYDKRLISYFNRMRESNERLREMATRDMLTNALNARTYYEICDSQIHVARRQQTPFAVLFVDLDHFKLVNDTYGHAAGDIVLKAVADCLSRSVRASDTFGRVGGEEFSIFLPNTDATGAVALAESIRCNIETLMPSTGEQTLKITASIGVARNSEDEQTMLDIQKKADQAMYRAKEAGRNRVSSLHDDITVE